MQLRRKTSDWVKAGGFIAAAVLLFSLILVDVLRVKNTDASIAALPGPNIILSRSKAYSMPLLKGLKLDSNDPLHIDFIVDTADQRDLGRDQAGMLISYFLAALTIPEQDLWVNLSPYEHDRIVPQQLGDTDMGRELLEQDYILKQFSSSLTHPDTELGRQYWSSQFSDIESRISAETQGFSKVWVVPGQVEILEHDNVAFITEATLKAQSEADANILIPTIEHELNQGKNFAELRQVYNALILGLWFKQKFKESFYKYYFDQAKINGIEIDDKQVEQKIWQLYCKSFNKGVYDLVRKNSDPISNPESRISKRNVQRFFSGGMNMVSASALVAENTVAAEIENIADEINGTGGKVKLVSSAIRNAVDSLERTRSQIEYVKNISKYNRDGFVAYLEKLQKMADDGSLFKDKRKVFVSFGDGIGVGDSDRFFAGPLTDVVANKLRDSAERNLYENRSLAAYGIDVVGLNPGPESDELVRLGMANTVEEFRKVLNNLHRSIVENLTNYNYVYISGEVSDDLRNMIYKYSLGSTEDEHEKKVMQQERETKGASKRHDGLFKFVEVKNRTATFIYDRNDFRALRALEDCGLLNKRSEDVDIHPVFQSGVMGAFVELDKNRIKEIGANAAFNEALRLAERAAEANKARVENTSEQELETERAQLFAFYDESAAQEKREVVLPQVSEIPLPAEIEEGILWEYIRKRKKNLIEFLDENGVKYRIDDVTGLLNRVAFYRLFIDIISGKIRDGDNWVSRQGLDNFPLIKVDLNEKKELKDVLMAVVVPGYYEAAEKEDKVLESSRKHKDALSTLVSDGKTDKEGLPVSLVYGGKAINTIFGHGRTDTVLKYMSGVVKESMSPEKDALDQLRGTLELGIDDIGTASEEKWQQRLDKEKELGQKAVLNIAGGMKIFSEGKAGFYTFVGIYTVRLSDMIRFDEKFRQQADETDEDYAARILGPLTRALKIIEKTVRVRAPDSVVTDPQTGLPVGEFKNFAEYMAPESELRELVMGDYNTNVRPEEKETAYKKVKSKQRKIEVLEKNASSAIESEPDDRRVVIDLTASEENVSDSMALSQPLFDARIIVPDNPGLSRYEMKEVLAYRHLDYYLRLFANPAESKLKKALKSILSAVHPIHLSPDDSSEKIMEHMIAAIDKNREQGRPFKTLFDIVDLNGGQIEGLKDIKLSTEGEKTLFDALVNGDLSNIPDIDKKMNNTLYSSEQARLQDVKDYIATKIQNAIRLNPAFAENKQSYDGILKRLTIKDGQWAETAFFNAIELVDGFVSAVGAHRKEAAVWLEVRNILEDAFWSMVYNYDYFTETLKEKMQKDTSEYFNLILAAIDVEQTKLETQKAFDASVTKQKGKHLTPELARRRAFTREFLEKAKTRIIERGSNSYKFLLLKDAVEETIDDITAGGVAGEDYRWLFVAIADYLTNKATFNKQTKEYRMKEREQQGDKKVFLMLDYVPTLWQYRDMKNFYGSRLAGVACDKGSTNAHWALAAAADGVKVFMVNTDHVDKSLNGKDIIYNGKQLIAGPSQTDLSVFKQAKDRNEAIKAKIEQTASVSNVKVYANADTNAGIGGAVDAGANKIGLFRSEMSYSGITTPTMDDYRETILQAVRVADGRQVIVRGLDFKSDKKPVSLADIIYDGGRFTLPDDGLFYEQWDGAAHSRLELEKQIGRELVLNEQSALYQEYAKGRGGAFRIMMPMLDGPQDFDYFVSTVKEAIAWNKGRSPEETEIPEDYAELGTMIETAYSVDNIDEILKLIEKYGLKFISIGTNDMIDSLYYNANRYSIHDEAGKKDRYALMWPLVIKNIISIAGKAKQYGVEVSICGDLASKREFWPVLEYLERKKGIELVPSMPEESIVYYKAFRHMLGRMSDKELSGFFEILEQIEQEEIADVEKVAELMQNVKSSRRLLDRNFAKKYELINKSQDEFTDKEKSELDLYKIFEKNVNLNLRGSEESLDKIINPFDGKYVSRLNKESGHIFSLLSDQLLAASAVGQDTDVGGMDFAGIKIESASGSSAISVPPFDPDHFYGFTFSVRSIKDLRTKDSVVAFLSD